MDSQTRLEHTVALTAFVVCLVKLATERVQGGRLAPDPPWEMLDENRWLAARHGLDAQLFDTEAGERRGARELVEELLTALAPHAAELDCFEELDGVRDMLTNGNCARRQRLVFEANHDLRELTAEIVAATAVAEPPAAPA
jgi:glutamate---cysteine ligase / carboxylate-amine ligase